jgi:hypothetical protein
VRLEGPARSEQVNAPQTSGMAVIFPWVSIQELAELGSSIRLLQYHVGKEPGRKLEGFDARYQNLVSILSKVHYISDVSAYYQ